MLMTDKQAAIGPDSSLCNESLRGYIRKKLAKRNDISLCLAVKGVFRSRISRDSAGGAEERSAPQPEGIDGPRRAQRQLSLLPLLSTIALMKVLHQKKTKRKQAFAAAWALEDLPLNPPPKGAGLEALLFSPLLLEENFKSRRISGGVGG